MSSKNIIEIADQRSRARAIIAIVATLAFLGGQLIAGPFSDGPETARHLTRGVMWAINAIVLLLILATGAGVMNNRRIRALVNDEVSQQNVRTAAVAGFWVAMLVAITLYIVPASESSTAREAAYLIVTSAVAVAMLAFGWLEHRAHRDV